MANILPPKLAAPVYQVIPVIHHPSNNIIMSQPRHCGLSENEGLGAERKAKKIQVGIVSFGCNLGEMFTFMGRT